MLTSYFDGYYNAQCGRNMQLMSPTCSFKLCLNFWLRLRPDHHAEYRTSLETVIALAVANNSDTALFTTSPTTAELG